MGLGVSQPARHYSSAVTASFNLWTVMSRVGVGWRVSPDVSGPSPLTHFLFYTFLFLEMSLNFVFGPGPSILDEDTSEAPPGFTLLTKEEEEKILMETNDPPEHSNGVANTTSMECEGGSDVVVDPASVKKERKRRQRKNRAERDKAAKALLSGPVTPLTSGVGTKRQLSSGSPTTDSRDRNPPAPKKLLFRDAVAGSLRLYITFSDLEKGRLTEEDLNKFKEALEVQIFACKGKPRVQVDGCTFINGVGFVECRDEDTAKWIQDKVGSLLGGAYKSWKEGEMPPPQPDVRQKLHKMRCWVGGRVQPEPKLFFVGLAQQNNLDTRQWRLDAIVPRVGGHTFLFRITEESLQALERVDFRLYFGLSRLEIKRGGLSRGKEGIHTKGNDSDKPP